MKTKIMLVIIVFFALTTVKIQAQTDSVMIAVRIGIDSMKKTNTDSTALHTINFIDRNRLAIRKYNQMISENERDSIIEKEILHNYNTTNDVLEVWIAQYLYIYNLKEKLTKDNLQLEKEIQTLLFPENKKKKKKN